MCSSALITWNLPDAALFQGCAVVRLNVLLWHHTHADGFANVRFTHAQQQEKQVLRGVNT